MDTDHPVKDEENERLVPMVWRTTILAIGECLNTKDYKFEKAPSNVKRVDVDIAEVSAYQIESYGCQSVTITELSWQSSIYIWMGKQWDVIIDLIDENGSRTDLILKLSISENGQDFIFKPDFVYVP